MTTTRLHRTPDAREEPARAPRVVHVIDHLGWGGAERLLLQYLPFLRDAGFDLRVCVLTVREGNPVAAEIRALGIPVDMVRVDRLRDLTAVPRLVRYLRAIGADLVHTQLEFADALGTVAARVCRIPSVSTLHTMSTSPKWSRGWWRNSIGDRLLGRFSHAVICVSDSARRYYLDQGRYPAGVLRTVRNGIDLSRYPGDASVGSAVRGELGIPVDAPLLVSVAVLREAKGLDRVIAALPTLPREVHYLVVGDGEHRDALRASARQHGVDGRVHFAGARTDVPDVLAACQVFVHPTLQDALPTVLAEAAAAGLPIVASDVGGVPEMVIDGRNGVLVPPDDVPALAAALTRLLGDPDKARRMGLEGRAVARERFDIATQAGRLAKVYRSFLGSGR